MMRVLASVVSGWKYFTPEGWRRRSLPLEVIESEHFFPRTKDAQVSPPPMHHTRCTMQIDWR